MLLISPAEGTSLEVRRDWKAAAEHACESRARTAVCSRACSRDKNKPRSAALSSAVGAYFRMFLRLWRVRGSNSRRLRRLIYSQIPLAAWVTRQALPTRCNHLTGDAGLTIQDETPHREISTCRFLSEGASATRLAARPCRPAGRPARSTCRHRGPRVRSLSRNQSWQWRRSDRPESPCHPCRFPS